MSSLRGARIAGKRVLNASTIAAVSSTESVVWVRKARFAVVRQIDGGDVIYGFDERHRPGRDLAEGADHFRVARMADEEDVPPFLDQPLRLAMNLRNEWTGRIDIGEAAVLRFGGDRLGNAVRGEDHWPVVGHFVELVDEHRAQFASGDRRRSGCGRSRDGHRPARRIVRARARRSGSPGRPQRRSRAGRRSALKGRVVQHSESHVSLRLQP